MTSANIPFETTDWADVATSEHRGEFGKAIWRTLQQGVKLPLALAELGLIDEYEHSTST
jgi:hypothetical protein